MPDGGQTPGNLREHVIRAHNSSLRGRLGFVCPTLGQCRAHRLPGSMRVVDHTLLLEN